MGDVRIKGKERFRRQLHRLGANIVEELKPELERNARDLEAAIRPDIPKAEGDLETTLDAYEVTDSNGQAWRVVEGAARGTGGKGFYATWQEFGWFGHSGSPHFFYHVRRLRVRFRARLSRAARKAIMRNFRNGG